MYPSRHGAYTLGTKLPESVPTIGDALRLRNHSDDDALQAYHAFAP